MAEQKKGTLSLSCPSGVKKTSPESSGKVRQSFSHGKTKVVTVEVKRKGRMNFRAGANQGASGAENSLSERYAGGTLTTQEIENRSALALSVQLQACGERKNGGYENKLLLHLRFSCTKVHFISIL